MNKNIDMCPWDELPFQNFFFKKINFFLWNSTMTFCFVPFLFQIMCKIFAFFGFKQNEINQRN